MLTRTSVTTTRSSTTAASGDAQVDTLIIRHPLQYRSHVMQYRHRSLEKQHHRAFTFCERLCLGSDFSYESAKEEVRMSKSSKCITQKRTLRKKRHL